jgi:PAS domain S-box-containing protein
MLTARSTQGEGILPVTPELESERSSHLEILYRLTDRLSRATGLEAVLDIAMDAITEGLGCEKCSILLFDAQRVMRFVAWRGLSENYRRTLDGHTPWSRETVDPAPIFVSDITATNESAAVKKTILAEKIRSLAFIPLTAQGKVIGKFMAYHGKARGCSEAQKALAITIARQIGFSIERVQAEAARRAALNDLVESEQRFRLMAEHAPVMIWMCDATGQCLHLNLMLRRFWDVEEERIGSFDWRESLHPEDVEHVMTHMGTALARQENVTVTGRYRNAEGTYRTLETLARPRFAADGTFMGLTGVNTDITERERSQEQRELLLAELNHRVKNTLAVVQGLAYQTFRQTDAPARKAFEGRLLALARAHDLLTQSHWESTSLQQLAADTLQLAGANGQRVRAEGPPVSLRPHAALTISLALHELFTNTLKYGALSNDTGTVSFCWKHLAEEGKLRIEWREQGGPPVMPPVNKGFGSLLLERTLARDLNGSVELSFAPSGLACVIEMPFV